MVLITQENTRKLSLSLLLFLYLLSRLSVDQRPVLQRFRRFPAHSLDAMRFVLVVAALVKRDLRVAFKGDDVRGDFVEEPSVVGDDKGATVPGEQGFFQSAQSGDVQVVRRFVQ